MPRQFLTSETAAKVAKTWWDSLTEEDLREQATRIRRARRMNQVARHPGFYDRVCLYCETWYCCYNRTPGPTCRSPECDAALKSDAGKAAWRTRIRKSQPPKVDRYYDFSRSG